MRKRAYVLSGRSLNGKRDNALATEQGQTEYSLLLVLFGFPVRLDQTELLLCRGKNEENANDKSSREKEQTSQSPKMMFMCLSKAMNLPTRMRPSSITILIL